MSKLPAGWKKVKLLECLLEPPKYGINAPAVKYDNSLPTYIRITDIDEYGNFISKNKVSVNNENYNKYILEENDLVFARTGSVGKTYLYNKKDGLLVFAGYLIKVKPNQNILISQFLKQYTNSSEYFKFIKTTSQRTVQAGINAKEYGNMEISLPPLNEQKRIASALSKIDAYLENTIKLIEEKERFKRGIAKKLLTCKEGENIPEARFKGFEDEWETKTLNSISNIKKGEQKNKLDLIADGKYPVLNGGMNFSGYCNSYNREANTITISEGGNAGYVNFIKEKFWSSGHCYTLHDLKIDKYFLYQCLKNSEKRLMKLQLGTALKNIRQSEIVEFELNIPKSIKEQEKIGGYLSLLDEEIDNLKKQKELIKEMKRGAMQKLLSGEVRLLE
ncbi:restriction endonuclease subunit S [uncultured Brachyspira sp.]|uniref:restriction endonuclease subunit S n=1 Tax=uncultured Brachyspira sp. TaxID=221953 RepID=UPI00258E776E|nr:restriction endonuclease subunit S [uncultured Brachyspira sp.]